LAQQQILAQQLVLLLLLFKNLIRSARQELERPLLHVTTGNQTIKVNSNKESDYACWF